MYEFQWFPSEVHGLPTLIRLIIRCIMHIQMLMVKIQYVDFYLINTPGKHIVLAYSCKEFQSIVEHYDFTRDVKSPLCLIKNQMRERSAHPQTVARMHKTVAQSLISPCWFTECHDWNMGSTLLSSLMDTGYTFPTQHNFFQWNKQEEVICNLCELQK